MSDTVGVNQAVAPAVSTAPVLPVRVRVAGSQVGRSCPVVPSGSAVHDGPPATAAEHEL
ncbi:hypothetical protein WDV91_09770 [Curtobacterium flaccumfaciens pv. flaccumfaciens]